MAISAIMSPVILLFGALAAGIIFLIIKSGILRKMWKLLTVTSIPLVSATEDVTTKTKGLSDVFEPLITKIKNVYNAFKDLKESGGIMNAVYTTVTTIISKIVTFLANNIPRMITNGLKLLTAILKGITDNIGLITTAMGTVITTIIDFILTNGPKIIAGGLQILQYLVDAVSQNSTKIGEFVFGILDTIVTFITDNAEKIYEFTKKILQYIVDAVFTNKNKIGEFITGLVDTLGDFVITNADKLITIGTTIAFAILAGMGKAIKDNWKTVVLAALTGTLGAVLGAMIGTLVGPAGTAGGAILGAKIGAALGIGVGAYVGAKQNRADRSFNDFVQRPGQNATRFSASDTLIGMKRPEDLLGKGGSNNMTYAPIITVNATVSSDYDVRKLAGELNKYWSADMDRISKSRNGL
jgi:hypothetical protein